MNEDVKMALIIGSLIVLAIAEGYSLYKLLDNYDKDFETRLAAFSERIEGKITQQKMKEKQNDS